MHVALVTHDYPPKPHSGVGTCTANLAEGLVRAGHRATVFVCNHAPQKSPDEPERTETTQNGVRVIWLYLRSPKWMRWRPGMVWHRLRLLKTIKQEHRKDPFDILETADVWGWLPFFGVPGVPTVCRMNASSFFYDHLRNMLSTDHLTHWFEKATIARADHLIAVSDFLGREQLKVSKSPNAPYTVIHNAVDTDMFCSDPSITSVEGTILFVNFVERRKGIFELGEAFNMLAPRYPKAKLIFAGRVNVLSDGKPISAQVLEKIRPEFHNRVEFLGWQSREQVRDLLRKANVCCYPSHLEAFALAPLEAMSTGRPVVFAAHGAGPEAIEHGVSGLLCNERDPRDIAEKLSQVFDNPDLARKMGQAARERVLRLFSQKTWVQWNIQFFEQCLGKAPAR